MEVYARHGRALLRKAERLLQSRADAQDLVQGIVVELLARGHEPDLPYLYRAVTTRAVSFLRDEKNRARLLAEHDVALRGPVRTRCDDQIIGLDLLLKLEARLDATTMEILVFRYFDDMTQDEIAEVVGLSRKTVGKKLDDVREAVARLATGNGGAS